MNFNFKKYYLIMKNKIVKLGSYMLFIFMWFNITAQENNLCVGYYWTPEEANIKMKEFASTWHDSQSWEKRADRIREGIIKGMKLDKMPDIKGNFNVKITNSRELDGYIVENIRIESFPGFYITGNIYRPLKSKEKNPAVLCAHGHGENQRFKETRQYQGAVLARMGAIVIAYDMVGHGESHQVTSHSIPIALLLQTWN